MSPSTDPLAERCDSLYVSPHADDFALSCAARLASERGHGNRILVVTLFGADEGESGEAASPAARARALLGARLFAAGMPEAAKRNRYYDSFRTLSYGRHPDDDTWALRTIRILTEVADRTRPREVYVPLAIGGHIDHRLAHEAALTIFESREGCNVFLYEDRPEAVIPGAVRIRLGQLGARLPPAAGSVEGARLARFLLRFHLAPSYRGDLRGWAERMRSARVAARSWRETKRWRPHKGLGLRLQPVVHHPEPQDLDRVRDLREALRPPQGSRSAAAARRLGRLLSAYSQRLGGEHAERYWLLLPPRDAEGRVAVTASGLYDTVPP